MIDFNPQTENSGCPTRVFAFLYFKICLFPAFLGINNGLYTYPKTVREGRLKDITKIAGANQWPSNVLFPNRLNNTKYYY